MKTTLRSVLSAVLCYLMLLSVCSAAFPRAMAISGSGTESSPYRITTAEELQYVMTNYGSREGVCLSLQNDIIIPDDYAAPDTFAGVLDGNGHTVTTSVYLIKTNKGTIKNLYRVSSYHTYSSYNESFPLCQYNEGVIRKIVVQGNIVSVSAYKIGGITEENLSSGTIDCCALIGDVRGYDDGCDAGGITAKNSGTICSCYVIGSIYDGVDWYYDSVSYGIAPSYTNCFYYNTREEMRGLETHVMNRLNGSTVSGESWWTKDTENKNDGLPVPASQYSLEATISGPADATLLSSSYSTTVSLSCSDSNAVIRYTTDGSIPTANSPVYSSYGKSFNGTAKITVAAFRSGKSSHPYTFTVKKITGSGTAASPYLIDDEEALRRISKLGTNKYYRQTADITITRPFDTLSEFSGLYDGDGYTISDFYTEGYASFTADNTGEIRNLKIAASTHEPTRVMGLFAETNHGMLSNCSIAGKMENYREYPYCHNICFGAMVDTNYGVMDHCADIEAIYISAIRYFIDLHYRPRKPVDGGFVYKNCGIVRYVKGQVNGAIYRETYYDESNIIQEYCEPLAEGHRHTFVKGTPQVFPCSYYGHCKYVCSGCGETIDQTYYRPYFEDISYEGIVDHTYVEFEGKAATCTEIGWYAYHTCSVCGYTDYQEIPMLPHTPQVVTPGVAATCTTDGLTDYAVCSVCGAVIQQQETIPAPGHQWNAGTVTTPATCRENGVKTFTCTACDETRTEIIPQTTEFSWDGGVATVPADETGIAGYACYNFKDLTGVMLPDSVTSIGAYAFYGCTGLKDVYYAGSEAQRKNITIAGSNSPLTAATWHYNCAVEEGSCGKNATWQLTPYGTLTISGTGAMYNYNDSSSLSPFYHRADVKKVIVENGVTNIGNYAFSGCEELTEVTLPDSVKGIGRFAFYGCTGLTAVALPDGLTGLGIGAFRDCAGLTDVTIPEGIISVAAELFRNCQSLTGIIIPDGVTSVGAYAFANCAGLTELVIPDNVTSISQFAFSGCTGLTSITVPLSVSSIGNNAFNGCAQLASVRYEGLPADWDAVSIGKNNSSLTAADFEWHCKLPHQYIATADMTPATMTADGSGTLACSLCGATTEATIPHIAAVTLSADTFVYTGAAQRPDVTITDSEGAALTQGEDYTLTLPEDSTAVGTYTLTVSFTGKYASTAAKTYTIAAQALAAANVTRTPIAFYANGKQQQPTVTVVNAAGQTLKVGTDYRVVYPESVEPGSYMVRVDGINNYKGTIRKVYTVKPVEALAAASVTRTPTVFYANGKQQQPKVTVVNAAGQTLKEGTDYRVVYPESVEPGSYMVRVDGINSYKGTIRKAYTVKQARESLDASRITRTPTVFYANGQQQQPTVTVVNAAGQTLKEGMDYRVTYPESVEPGSYMVRVDGINSYKGTIRKVYTVKPVEALAAANVTRTPTVFYANGQQQQPTVTVVNAAGQTLKEGTDYKVTYPESIEPGSYMVRVDGLNGYSGAIRKVYTIK